MLEPALFFVFGGCRGKDGKLTPGSIDRPSAGSPEAEAEGSP